MGCKKPPAPAAVQGGYTAYPFGTGFAIGDHIILHVVIVFTLLGTIRVEVIILANESVYFAIDKDVGLHDTTLLKRALDSLPGVSSIKINKQSSSISVDYDTTSVTQAEIRKKIELLGYPVQPTY